MSFSLFQRGIPQEGKILVGAGGMAVSNEFSLHQRENPHEEIILVGEGREVESAGRISQNDILLKFQWGFFLRQRGHPHIPYPLEVAMSFSLRQRGNPHEENFLVGGGGVEVTRENISKRYSIEVSMRFFSLSMRKPSHSFPLPQGNSPHEDFLFDEEKTSWQLSRTAMSFSLRQRRNSHERKILLGG